MENNSIIKQNKYILFAFTGCFIMVFIAEIFFMNATWTCDAGDYWNRGELIKSSGFSLDSIDSFRGYIFPLFLGVINYLGGRRCWYVINAAVIAVFAAFIIPMVTKDDRDFGKKELIQTTSFWALFSLLFVGAIVYPLSDLFAVINIFAAMLFLKKSAETDKTAIRFISVFLTGVFCYLSYNTRTIYLFACFTVPVIYIILRLCNQTKKKIDIKKLLLTGAEMGAGFLGAVAAAIPQIIMNTIHLGKLSMSVPTSGLMLSQMSWGIRYQRYDTYLPLTVDELHPNPQVFFIDNTGIRILEEMGMAVFEDWGDFLSLFFHHPVDVITIYVRHLVNYVFPCWPTMYITDLNNSKWLWGLLGFTIFPHSLRVYQKMFEIL